MKKIMETTLCPDYNQDIDGNIYTYDEYSEAEYGDEWDGDVCGYLENFNWPGDPDDIQIRKADECDITICECHEDAYLVITDDSCYIGMYWPVEA